MNNQGWICPICRRVWAPFIMECKTCNKDIKMKMTPFSAPLVPFEFPTPRNNNLGEIPIVFPKEWILV